MSRLRNPEILQGGIAAPQLPTSVEQAGLPEEMRLALQMRKQALQGFTAPENAALRSQMALERQGAEQARRRQLAQDLARSGVRGGAAAAAQGRQQQLASQEAAKQAQELFLRNIAQKQQALGQFEEAAQGGLKTVQNQQFMNLATQLAQRQMDINRDIAEKQAAAIKEYGWLGALGQQDDDESRRMLQQYYANMRPGSVRPAPAPAAPAAQPIGVFGQGNTGRPRGPFGIQF